MRLQEHIPSDQFSILYRTNAQSRAIEDALRKKNIKYKIYGGTSFYQRKEIKDVLSYLRLFVNQNDEEALKRIINYTARGIGQTTIDKLVVAANHFKQPIYEILRNIDKVALKINSGTKTKLENFVNTIESLRIASQSQNAYEVADQVVKQVRLVKDLEAEGTLSSFTS